MNLKLLLRKSGSTPVLEIHGDIIEKSISKIIKKLEVLIKCDAATIAIDMSKTTFIDSHGLGVFIFTWRRLKDLNRKLIFIKPQGFINDLFNETSLSKIFEIKSTEDDL
jgi:anti-sigma B factor antagonist